MQCVDYLSTTLLLYVVHALDQPELHQALDGTGTLFEAVLIERWVSSSKMNVFIQYLPCLLQPCYSLMAPVYHPTPYMQTVS